MGRLIRAAVVASPAILLKRPIAKRWVFRQLTDMQTRATATLSTIALAQIACVPPARVGKVRTCTAPGMPTHTWPLFAASGFTLRVPQGFSSTKAESIDSEVHAWSRSAEFLSFDYGAYSNRLDSASLTGLVDIQRCSARIGGHDADLVTGRTQSGQYFAGAHWSNLSRSSLGTTRLTVTGRASSIAAHTDLLATLWSVRFSPRSE